MRYILKSHVDRMFLFVYAVVPFRKSSTSLAMKFDPLGCLKPPEGRSNPLFWTFLIAIFA